MREEVPLTHHWDVSASRCQDRSVEHRSIDGQELRTAEARRPASDSSPCALGRVTPYAPLASCEDTGCGRGTVQRSGSTASECTPVWYPALSPRWTPGTPAFPFHAGWSLLPRAVSRHQPFAQPRWRATLGGNGRRRGRSEPHDQPRQTSKHHTTSSHAPLGVPHRRTRRMASPAAGSHRPRPSCQPVRPASLDEKEGRQTVERRREQVRGGERCV
jgi:hypothetical protein